MIKKINKKNQMVWLPDFYHKNMNNTINVPYTRRFSKCKINKKKTTKKHLFILIYSWEKYFIFWL